MDLIMPLKTKSRPDSVSAYASSATVVALNKSAVFFNFFLLSLLLFYCYSNAESSINMCALVNYKV